MTLDDIKSMTKATITPAAAAAVLGCDPHYIRVAAREQPQLLRFQTIVIGSRVKIPRIAFINFMEGKSNGSAADEAQARPQLPPLP